MAAHSFINMVELLRTDTQIQRMLKMKKIVIKELEDAGYDSIQEREN